MAPAQSALHNKRDYLVCSWPLNAKRNGVRRCDALSRTLSSALLRRRRLHVWCELAMISFTPEFLEVWSPVTTRGGKVDYRERRLCELMRDIFADVIVKGASIRHFRGGDNTPKSVIEAILQDTEHVLFLDLNKRSCALHIEGETVEPSSDQQSAGNELVVLGGVEDMSPEEEATILEVCREHDVSHHTVSLGQRQLFTSQCVKILEAVGATGLLQKGLAYCKANHWRPDRGLSCRSKQGPPLHVVKVIDESIESFIKSAEAAALLVDMFMFSHGGESAELSLVSTDATLTVPRPPPKQLILQEASAHEYLQQVAADDKHMRKSIRVPGFPITQDASIAHGLTQVLLPKTSSKKNKSLSKHLILLAQDGSTSEVAPLSLPSVPSHVSDPIAVIIAPGKFAKTICEVSKTAKKLQSRYLGRAQEVPSFVSMLFNDGLLADMIISPQQPSAPEVASTTVELQSEGHTDIPDQVAENKTEVRTDASIDVSNEVAKIAPKKTEVRSDAGIDVPNEVAQTAPNKTEVRSDASIDIPVVKTAPNETEVRSDAGIDIPNEVAETAPNKTEVRSEAGIDIPNEVAETAPNKTEVRFDAGTDIVDEVSTVTEMPHEKVELLGCADTDINGKVPEFASNRTEVRSDADTDIGDDQSGAFLSGCPGDDVSTSPEAVAHTKVPSEVDTDIGDEASVVISSIDSRLCSEWICNFVEKRIRTFAKKEAAITKLAWRQAQNAQLNADEAKKVSTGPIVREVLFQLMHFQSACIEKEQDAIVELLRLQIRKFSKKQKYGKASELEMLVLKELCSVREEFNRVFGDADADAEC